MNEELVRVDRSGAGVEDAYFNFNVEPLRDGDEVYGMMVVALDITEQVRARQVLQEANRAKDEFLAMLGHELRNPLAPIVTAIELMNEKVSTAEKERTVIERQVRHVIRLVDDLLDVSRIARGMIRLELRVVDLADVVAAAVEANRPLDRAARTSAGRREPARRERRRRRVAARADRVEPRHQRGALHATRRRDSRHARE